MKPLYRFFSRIAQIPMGKLPVVLWFIFLMSVSLTGFAQAAPSAQDAPPSILLLKSDGPLTPSMVGYLERGIRAAEQSKAEALIFQINTPGGSIELMNQMIQEIRASRVPIIVYVAPAGAMAGSAGTMITLAGHAAAMAPDTTIGAASPVGQSGQELDATASAKAKNILKATVRTLAERRGQEALELAQRAIDNAEAASAKEALENGLVDFLAMDINDLLRQLNRYEVETAAGKHFLNTENAAVTELPLTFIERLLSALTNPNILILLLNVGTIAIIIELSSPGGWISGFIGVICLALAIYGMGVLPINWFGIFFLILAFTLFILDLKTPTHGALTAAGIGCLIVAGLVLFNSPNIPAFERVSVPLLVSSSVISGAVFFVIMLYALRAQKAPLRMGMESMIGKKGIVIVAIDPRGQIQMGGEQWSAELTDDEPPIAKGTHVQVVGVHGVKLRVRAMYPQPTDQNPNE